MFPTFRLSLAAPLLTAGMLGLLAACRQPAATSPTTTAPKQAAAPPATAAAPVTNPVLPGDYPDPSVDKLGDTYWASATTSNWGPVFPLLKSKNLSEWELVGHVFPDAPPAWADYYFWAPEISFEKDKTYIYYTAHKRGGNLCVAVASADRPEGPYTDHGPLVGQEAGSIDGFPMRDENGVLYLIWKEDGNSRNLPTPIWAQQLSEDRKSLLGQPRELFRNDQRWEGNLVEGVSMIRRGEYFYAFYAGNGCCGNACTYGTGVARAKKLLGPWEKYAQNPVMLSNDTWKCPGHGSVTERGGQWFLLHHAYHNRGWEYVGRQGVLSEFRWTAAGWPEFINQRTPGTPGVPTTQSRQTVRDDFKGRALGRAWQWPVETKPSFALKDGQLRLTARPDAGGAALGHPIYTADFTATTTLLEPGKLPAGAAAGLAALGDPENTLALTAGGGKLQLWQLEKGKRRVLGETALPPAPVLTLRLEAQGGKQYRFSYSTDGGKAWQQLPAGNAPINGAYLPPWDRGVRAGVLVLGPATVTAAFDDFVLEG
ncbi:family 43 glycosylhydrolase [Hymenobacter gummosus]|uniref:family 43 glycosylhydrolase n=1 Tax=Hymenobacter gummosus TaxID=1776032 RepID=UPI001FB549D4|nr:family 43 glycosylhydrolase [Hymenobacter gummosus]